MAKIRVLVVEDSLTVRKRLLEVLSTDSELEVVGEAEDGKYGIELCQALHPDVISMDMMMPVMSGLAATEFIMAYCPTPILIVSSSTNRGELFKTYDALSAGAVDVLEKYSEAVEEEDWERNYISSLKLVSRIRVITHPRGRLRSTTSETFAERPENAVNRLTIGQKFKVVAVGASTGGPSALVDLLHRLPSDFPLPILIVLHISPTFALAFADWLDGQTQKSVSYAQEGHIVEDFAGKVVMAPPTKHLTVQNGRFRLTTDPERHSCRPSVDVLYESVAKEYQSSAIGCLLTGMGRDGAAGLLALKNAGAFTMAQDEATSVVYGMPREAAILGAAKAILPLEEIGPAIGALINPSRSSK